MKGELAPVDEIFCEVSIIDGLSCELTFVDDSAVIEGEMAPIDEIDGDLSSIYEMTCELSPMPVLECEVSQSIGAIYYDHYGGPYNVIPKWVDQILDTKKLVMDENVLVNAIGLSVTQNPSGGNTVYIGG